MAELRAPEIAHSLNQNRIAFVGSMINHSCFGNTGPTMESRYRIDTLARADSALEIRWQDGHVSRYPGIWLLEACRCERCGDTATAVRHLSLLDKPPRPQIESLDHDEHELHLDWGDDHRSSYALAWLRDNCLSAAERARRRVEPQLWGREMAQRLPYMDYARVADSPERQLQFLETILDFGFVILRGVPAAAERTEEITSLVGKLRLTNYGIYELKSKPNPEIVGDMAVSISPHTDEPYRVDPPGITFFHVIQQAAAGGASTLLDGFNLAQRLRREKPEAFAILSTIPARFHRSLIEGRCFEYQSPVIHVNSEGDVVALRMLDRGMAPVDCAPERVEPFYDALRELLELADRGDDGIEFRLESGEMLVFNNQRLLHGRTAFDGSSGRHVRSCHVDLDEFHSRLRVMYRERSDPRQWTTFRRD